jgi:hydrogenase nickel incorporation protein HypA/HybF
MHEVGITQSIIEIAEKHALEGGARKVLSLTVEIGELSGVVPEAVEFAFEACSRGTLLEESKLIIESIPGRARCGDCRRETGIDRYSFACPSCDAFALEILQGEELRIKEMEVD